MAEPMGRAVQDVPVTCSLTHEPRTRGTFAVVARVAPIFVMTVVVVMTVAVLTVAVLTVGPLHVENVSTKSPSLQYPAFYTLHVYRAPGTYRTCFCFRSCIGDALYSTVPGTEERN